MDKNSEKNYGQLYASQETFSLEEEIKHIRDGIIVLMRPC